MNSSSQPLVSIVTPVYNEEAHLAECIESVLAQTYQNWDYTILDNCSTDRSVEIAHRYAQKDHRIRVKQNGQFLAVIPNHNAALRQISPGSKYCKLVFGDDWMFPECLQRMIACAEEHPSVGIVGAYRLEGSQVGCVGLPHTNGLFPGLEICRQHFLNGVYVFGSATALLYRADLVRSHDPFYNEANIHGDTEACIALLKTCDFGFIHQVLTFTRLREQSLRAISADMAYEWATMLRLLVTHGPDCLTREELKARLEQHLSEYYRFLGKSLLRGRDKKFWGYHKRGFAEMGIAFSRTRVAREALAVLCDAVLNPKRTAELLGRKLRSSSREPERKKIPGRITEPARHSSRVAGEMIEWREGRL
jgi:glycosyltransferase involved in cell wall biosynthesis